MASIRRVVIDSDLAQAKYEDGIITFSLSASPGSVTMDVKEFTEMVMVGQALYRQINGAPSPTH